MTYPITDALGSVRGLTDSSGSPTSTASYDVFGAVRSSSGSVGSLGYTGALTDSSGLVYLQARSLDPASGTFTSRDPLTPGGPGITGFNPYTYAGANPTTYSDPSGAMAEYAATYEPEQVSRPSVGAVGLSVTLRLLQVGLRLAFVLSILAGESCVLGGPCLLPRPWDDGIPQDDTRSLASDAETAAHLTQEMAIAVGIEAYQLDQRVLRAPQVWRLVTSGYGFNWKPSRRDDRGLSGSLGGPQALSGSLAPWNTDPYRWARQVLRNREPNPAIDRVVAAQPAVLMSMFSVELSADGTSDPYHVLIGGSRPGIRLTHGGCEWAIDPTSGISQNSMSRVLASLFWTQVWP